MKERQGLAELMDMVGLLTAACSYQETIEIIVSKSAEVLKSDRACLIVKTKEGRLKIESGIPSVSHGVGMELTPETGEIFLRKVLDSKEPIRKDVSDPEVAYMGDFAKIYNINSFLAIPLYYEDKPIGILVLDFVGGHNISDDIFDKVQYLAHLAAIAINQELDKRENNERMRLVTLGENTARISHIISNKLMIIGGFSQFIIESISESLSGDKSTFNFEEAKSNLERVIVAVKECDSFIKSVKDFSKPKKFKAERVYVNDFLEDKIMALSKSGLGGLVKFKFDLDFDVQIASIDKSFMSDCIHDIIENAVHANAKIITLKTEFITESRKILISISNDGAKIDPMIINKIFDPFVTTKDNGTGIGLANVKTIMEVFHGGRVEVESSDVKTEFKIFIPSFNN